MKKMILFLILSICTVSLAGKKERKPDSSEGFSLSKCSEDKDAPTSIEYYADHRDFAKGAVRVFKADTDGEPACCSNHVLLLIPTVGEGPGGYQCLHLRAPGTVGGAQSVDLGRMQSTYNGKTGLTLDIPFTLYIDGVDSQARSAKVLVNPKKGTAKLLK